MVSKPETVGFRQKHSLESAWPGISIDRGARPDNSVAQVGQPVQGKMATWTLNLTGLSGS